MKMRWSLLVLISLLCAINAVSKEIVFFSARQKGEDVWSWSGARIKKSGSVLRIYEKDREHNYGDVYVPRSFPYLPEARLRINVKTIESGTYTVQALCMSGKSHFDTVNLINDSTTLGATDVSLSDYNFPEMTDNIILKIWVGGQEGAAMQLNNFEYFLPLDAFKIVLDDPLDQLPEEEKPSNADVDMHPHGLKMVLEQDSSYGALVLDGTHHRTTTDYLLINIPACRGRVSVQLAAFNAEGEYLGAVDLIKDVTSGWHGRPLHTLHGPKGTLQFRVKLWLSGNADAFAVFSRLLLLHDTR
jgi:hypothetical protein